MNSQTKASDAPVRLMAGKDLQRVGERQNPIPQRIEENSGHFTLPPREVWSADRADEQRFPGQDKPRLTTAALVGDYERHAVRRMADDAAKHFQ